MGVPGKVRHQYAVVPEGKKPRMQSPECVVQAAAVQENNRRKFVVEFLAAGGRKGTLSVNVEIHL